MNRGMRRGFRAFARRDVASDKIDSVPDLLTVSLCPKLAAILTLWLLH
jgi:hypothetical protein